MTPVVNHVAKHSELDKIVKVFLWSNSDYLKSLFYFLLDVSFIGYVLVSIIFNDFGKTLHAL